MPEASNTASPARRRGRLAVTALSLPLVLMFSACTPPPASSAGQSSDAAPAADLGSCGTVPEFDVKDVDGAVAALPAEVRAGYASYPEDVYASPWKDLPKADGPIKVGLSYLPIANPFGKSVLDQLEASFAEAKAEGLVEGELVKRIMPDPATMTPAEQIRGYQELVREGVDVILTTPLSGAAMVDVVNEAGEQGIVTVSLSGTIPSKYAVNMLDNTYLNVAKPTAEVVKQLGGAGDVLVVRGVPGLTTDEYGYNAQKAVLEKCPNINVVGEVVGNYIPAVAKSAVLQFLTSHPAKIDAVLQIGVMGSGAFAAFEQTGRDVPKITDSGASAGSLAYWKKYMGAQGYESAGTGGNGTQQAKAMFEVAMRTLQGEGLTVGTITRAPSMISNENIDQYLPAAADTTSPEEVLDGESWMESAYLDNFFTATQK